MSPPRYTCFQQILLFYPREENEGAKSTNGANNSGNAPWLGNDRCRGQFGPWATRHYQDNFHSDNNSIVINYTPAGWASGTRLLQCNRVCCPQCQQPKVLPKQHREPKTHFDEAIIQFSDTFTWASKISRQRGGKRPNSNTDMIQAKPMFSVETISLFGLKCRDWPIIISVFFQLQYIQSICCVLGVGRDKPSHNAILQLY